VLLIPAEKSFLRAVVGLMVCLLTFSFTSTVQPYKRVEDNALATASQLLLVVLFIGAILIKAFEDTAGAFQLIVGDYTLASHIFGYSSTMEVAVMLVVCTFWCAVMVLGSAAWAMMKDAAVPTLRLEKTNRPPELTMDASQNYMCFLSHVWSTGQDAAATIKRQLQRMLPTVKIFLDVDDLEDIGALETYVEETLEMLLFLSGGYLQSRNCLREVQATVDQDKPYMLVHEQDQTHGGAPLDKLMQQLTDVELRKQIFDGRVPIVWHRIADFQIVSLKLIAQEMLSHTPAYKGSGLSLVVPRGILQQTIKFPTPVISYTSQHNLGAFEILQALALAYSGVTITTTGPPPMPQSAVRSKGRRSSLFGKRGDPFQNIRSRDSGAQNAQPASMRKNSPQNILRVTQQSNVDRSADVHEQSSSTATTANAPSAVASPPPSPPGAQFEEGGNSEAPPSLGEGSLSRGKSKNVKKLFSVRSKSDFHGMKKSKSSTLHVDKQKGTMKDTGATTTADAPTHMLLYLNDKTFTGVEGNLLATEIRAARYAGLPIVMAHENDEARGGTPFSTFFNTTPNDLIAGGLYSQLAVAFMGGDDHRAVSMALFAKGFGAESEASTQTEKNIRAFKKLVSKQRRAMKALFVGSPAAAIGFATPATKGASDGKDMRV